MFPWTFDGLQMRNKGLKQRRVGGGGFTYCRFCQFVIYFSGLVLFQTCTFKPSQGSFEPSSLQSGPISSKSLFPPTIFFVLSPLPPHPHQSRNLISSLQRTLSLSLSLSLPFFFFLSQSIDPSILLSESTYDFTGCTVHPGNTTELGRQRVGEVNKHWSNCQVEMIHLTL